MDSWSFVTPISHYVLHLFVASATFTSLHPTVTAVKLLYDAICAARYVKLQS